jgi:Nuclear pore complex assembly
MYQYVHAFLYVQRIHIVSYAQRAVAILSDCRLNRDHTSKILVALSVSPDSEALIRRYIQTVKPPLVEPLDIEMYTLALADLSVLDAWQYTRSFSESDEIRPRMLKKVLEWAVTRELSLYSYCVTDFDTHLSYLPSESSHSSFDTTCCLTAVHLRRIRVE